MRTNRPWLVRPRISRFLRTLRAILGGLIGGVVATAFLYFFLVLYPRRLALLWHLPRLQLHALLGGVQIGFWLGMDGFRKRRPGILRSVVRMRRPRRRAAVAAAAG